MMFNKKIYSVVIILVVLLSISCAAGKKSSSNINKPNIIYILADDLGYGDLSSYGQTNFSTPNIDKLAKEGLLFTDHYSGSTVCAPSRSALMTGQHTGNTPIRGNKSLELPNESFTVAEMLQQNGYATGGFGKWGLGTFEKQGSPLKQGFDTFYGFQSQWLAHNYYPNHLWDNDKKIILEKNQDSNKGQYAPTLIHDKALSFIDTHKNEPFFLFYPSIIPHAELAAPKEYMDRFLGKYNPENNFKGVDKGKEFRKGRYASQPNSHAAFAAMITLLDDQVGEIVQKVKDLGLEENTIFIFTSDNGPHIEGGADPKYFDSNGVFRGFKRDLFEGGIRVPMIVKWKDKIKAGSTTNHPSAFWDVMPTFADIINVDVKSKIDGISFLPSLLNESSQKKHDYLYWEFHEKEGRQAIRKDNWKLVKYKVKTDKQNYFLFNLNTDPGETKNLAKDYPEKLKELTVILENARSESENFKF